jgi:hypothetical protein
MAAILATLKPYKCTTLQQNKENEELRNIGADN